MVPRGWVEKDPRCFMRACGPHTGLSVLTLGLVEGCTAEKS